MSSGESCRRVHLDIPLPYLGLLFVSTPQLCRFFCHSATALCLERLQSFSLSPRVQNANGLGASTTQCSRSLHPLAPCPRILACYPHGFSSSDLHQLPTCTQECFAGFLKCKFFFFFCFGVGIAPCVSASRKKVPVCGSKGPFVQY